MMDVLPPAPKKKFKITRMRTPPNVEDEMDDQHTSSMSHIELSRRVMNQPASSAMARWSTAQQVAHEMELRRQIEIEMRQEAIEARRSAKRKVQNSGSSGSNGSKDDSCVPSDATDRRSERRAASKSKGVEEGVKPVRSSADGPSIAGTSTLSCEQHTSRSPFDPGADELHHR